MMNSAFGVDHGVFSKSRVSAGHYKRAVDLTAREREGMKLSLNRKRKNRKEHGGSLGSTTPGRPWGPVRGELSNNSMRRGSIKAQYNNKLRRKDAVRQERASRGLPNG